MKSTVKTVSVMALAIAAAVAGAPPLLAIALALSSIGDLALSREGEQAFLIGIGAFAAAHLAYLALFLGQPPGDFGAVRLLVLLALLLSAGWLAPLLWRGAGPTLRRPVAIYVLIILCMALAALRAADPRLTLGAVLFAASDALIGAERFLWDAHTRRSRLAPYPIWALYWTAQAAFVSGFI